MKYSGHYDIIGDVHGHAGILERLLQKIGYIKQSYYRHPGRTAVFVGDIIDRGAENFRALEIVKPMVDNGSAFIVMGNHEYNALCYHTGDGCGGFLRPHNQKNYRQHKEVLAEIQNRGQANWDIYLEWFRRMPFFLELEGFRVVHACWDQPSVDFIKNNKIRDEKGRLTDEFLMQSVQEGSEAFRVVEELLKGREIMLPPGHPGIVDKDGNIRKKLRVKWWMPDREWMEMRTYDQVVRAGRGILEKVSGVEIPGDILEEAKQEWRRGMGMDHGVPVFFGHYWFTGEPGPLTEWGACLDYSAARGGPLVCYRWDGESILDSSKFVF